VGESQVKREDIGAARVALWITVVMGLVFLTGHRQHHLQGRVKFRPGSVMEFNRVVTPAQHERPAHIVGVGKPGSPLADYFYDYDVSLTEHWPNSVTQVPAITRYVQI
jgi:hypothetical protein